MKTKHTEMKTNRLIPVFVLLLASWPVVCNAQWSTDPSENNAVSNSFGMITMPHVAPTPSGDSYISWYSATDGFRFDVYLQSFGTDGTKKWGQDGLLISNHSTYTWVSDYGLAVDKKGYAILALQDIRDGVSNAFTYRISPDGAFSWGPDGIRLTDDPDENWWPQVKVNDANEAIFLYSVVPPDSVENWKFGFQKVDSTGTKVWNETILADSAMDFYMPQMLLTEQGNLIISWLAKSAKADTVAGQMNFFHIYLQKFDLNGQAVWPNPVQADSGYHMAFNSVYTVPYLVNNGADGAFVVWQSVSLGEPNVRVNKIASDGQVLWGGNGVGVENQPMQLSINPSAVYNPAEDQLYVFFQESDKNTGSSTLCGQKFSPAGEKVWGNEPKQMVPRIYSVDSSYLVSFIRLAPDNRLCLFWEKAYKSVNGADSIVQSDLYAGLVDADGNYLWPGDNVPVSTAVGNKLFFTTSEHASGQWIAAWADYRQHPLQAVFSNIYAQNISINGTLGPLSVEEPASTTGPVIICYPNPFNQKTTISFNTAKAGAIRLVITDKLGKEVQVLMNGIFAAGSYKCEFNGGQLPSGIYFIRLNSGSQQAVKKMVLSRW